MNSLVVYLCQIKKKKKKKAAIRIRSAQISQSLCSVKLLLDELRQLALFMGPITALTSL